MENIDEKNYSSLRIATRNQLITYPKRKKSSQIKSVIKSVYLRSNEIHRPKFMWPNGLLATSLEWSHKVSKEEKDIEALREYYDNWINKVNNFKFIDESINGYSLIYLHQYTNDKKYKERLDLIVQFLYKYPKSEDGSLPYRYNSLEKDVILVDGIGMVCPFLCRYGSTYNDFNAIELSVKLLMNFIEKGFDDNSWLPYHGYNSTNGNKLGIIGWGRGIGWLLIALVDSLEYIPKTHLNYLYLVESLNKIVSNVLEYQKKDGAFAWQISAIDGYSDTSSTSMIMYAISRAIMLEILDSALVENCDLALRSINVTIDEGKVYGCSAECQGIGMYPQRYGHYPWAQGPTTSLYALSIMKFEKK